jgi:SAM-dependent methyltransferase
MTSGATVLDRVRPEKAAGGYARDNGGVAFYTRINALLADDMTVVDLGAGRGEIFDEWPSYTARLMRLQGKVKHVIGLDVDAALSQHPHLDERHLITPDGAWPVKDGSVDLIVANWVLEHIENPRRLAAEVQRVLKPGGWFCARTPNRWGYVGLGSRMIPNTLHTGLLHRLWPGRHDKDVFPVAYKLNSVRDVRRHFPAPGWNDYSYTSPTTPKYFGRSRLLFHFIEMLQAMAPPGLQTDLLVFVQKAGS